MSDLINVSVNFASGDNTPAYALIKRLFVFGVLSSGVHRVWAKNYAGRLGEAITYSNTIVYNNFVFPKTGRDEISSISEKILSIRTQYADIPYSKLYDPSIMPKELVCAYATLDKTVMDAYNFRHSDDTYFNDDEILSGLIKLYKEAIDREKTQ